MKEIEKFVNELFLNVKTSKDSFEAKEQIKKELEITIRKWITNRTGATAMEDINEILIRRFGLSPEITTKMEEVEITFEDIFNLDNRSLQTLLLNIYNNQIIVYSLYELPEKRIERLMLNIPRARREMLYEQIRYLTAVKKEDVKKAREQMIQKVLELKKQNKITI